jgi:hypothetical protein
VILHGPRPDRDFTVLPNSVLRDEWLSYRARGLLAYMLSQPPDWEVSSSRLAIESGEGRDAIRTALRELTNAGYVRLLKEQDNGGRWQSHYIVSRDPWHFPQPVDNHVDNSLTGA